MKRFFKNAKAVVASVLMTAVVSSSMVKEIASHGGDINRFVPDFVAEAVYAKLKK